ncbi:helix-turn-helix domain-containing protein [Haloarchaeobius sp. DFWS5]|uniref:helix-turn-helix domain-containing protein n=1 Tax=Haloarchaeobius sp. DFWS5 TaxID=3446114 RepID=UPI003EBC7676
MSSIVTVEVPAAEFALSETLERLEDARFDIERVVSQDAQTVSPYIWAHATVGLEELEAALEADSSVENVKRLEQTEDACLYRMHFVKDANLVQYMITEEAATILNAECRDGKWSMRIMFPEHEGITRTSDFCADSGLDFEIQSIYEMTAQRKGRYGLTESQYETLTAACENGYYDVPREVNLEELAAQFDVSHQALSERIRRAHKALVEEALLFAKRKE